MLPPSIISSGGRAFQRNMVTLMASWTHLGIQLHFFPPLSWKAPPPQLVGFTWQFSLWITVMVVPILKISVLKNLMHAGKCNFRVTFPRHYSFALVSPNEMPRENKFRIPKWDFKVFHLLLRYTSLSHFPLSHLLPPTHSLMLAPLWPHPDHMQSINVTGEGKQWGGWGKS